MVKKLKRVEVEEKLKLLGLEVFTPREFKDIFHIPKEIEGVRFLVDNEYITAYTLVHLPKEEIVKGKMQALINRHKPRDFYDYFFLLSGNYPLVKEEDNLAQTRKLLKEAGYNFRNELRELLPASHLMHLRDFKKVLEQKILSFGK